MVDTRALDDVVDGLPDELATLIRATVADVPGALAGTVAADPRATVRPAGVSPSRDEALRAEVDGLRASLPPLTSPAGEPRLELGRTLGEGGMGVVRLGRQRVLGRDVAVKTLRGAAPSQAASLRLLREAWIVAALEHPNVVPVYDLAVSEGGAPVLVLRLVEGASWASFLVEPALVEARLPPGGDPLELHLRTFVRICEAVGLAHARGILHRDIKPENVMLGGHGEVYLVDWGIAVTLERDPTGRLPWVGDAREVAGTPAYMAPELLCADVAKMGPATDVYLLGATLYEVVAGRPPHDGPSLAAIAKSVLVGAPPLGADVPAELAGIVHRAMASDPAARYASVDALKDAVLVFLGHRGSAALAEGATRALVALEALVSADVAAADRAEVWAALGEARFGFRQALAGWSDNAAAREGLVRAVTAATRFELRRGSAASASALLAELDAPPPELAAEVRAAVEREEARRRDAERLARDHDPAFGRRTRALVLVAFATLWTAAPFLWAWLGPAAVARHVATTTLLAGFGVVQFALALFFAVWARASMFGTATNRRAVGLGLGMPVFQIVLALVVARLDPAISEDAVAAVFFTYWAFAAFVAGVALRRAFFVYAVAMTGALAVHVAWPGTPWVFAGLANLATFLFPALEARALLRDGRLTGRRPDDAA